MRKTTVCTDCRTEFTWDHQAGAVRQRCDTCRTERKRQSDRAKSKRWREANPDRARDAWNRSNRKRLADPEHLRKKREDAMRRAYGIGADEFDALLARQGGVCAICQGAPNGPGSRFHIDHCHASNVVRGLLCSKCNTAIGLMDDDPKRFAAAVEYLRR